MSVGRIRISTGWRLLGLALAATGLFLMPGWQGLTACLAAVLATGAALGILPRTLLRQLRPVLWIMLPLLGSQIVLAGWQAGLVVGVRLACLILLGALLTLTTSTTEMMESLERGLQPLRHVGFSPGRISFTLSMALRFIPVLSGIAQEIRDAQRARGNGGSAVAFAVPMILRTLQTADHVAEAIAARGYDPQAGQHDEPCS